MQYNPNYSKCAYLLCKMNCEKRELNYCSCDCHHHHHRHHQFAVLCLAVCAEAFNPDEDEEDKEPWVGREFCSIILFC